MKGLARHLLYRITSTSRTLTALRTIRPPFIQPIGVPAPPLPRLALQTSFSHSTKDKAASFEEFRRQEEAKEQQFEAEYKAEADAQKASEKQSAAPDPEAAAEDEAVRQKVLTAALEHVHTLGWRVEALVKGAETVGLPAVAHGMFPRGAAELVEFFNERCTAQMVERIQAELLPQKLPARELATQAIRARLELVIPYKKTWPQALAVMSARENAPTAIKNLLLLADEVCYYAGDRSVDLKWYARRIGLASVYKASEVFMLQDASEGHAETWKFLAQRIEDASLVHDVLLKGEGMAVSGLARNMIETVRNVLGTNYNRR